MFVAQYVLAAFSRLTTAAASVFATSNGATGLQRVPASGGAATVVTRPNAEQGEADHLFPEWLPGGRAVLFTITAARGGTDASKIAVLDMQTGKYTVVIEGGSHARYVSAHPNSNDHAGYLIYAAAGSLRAVQFDLSGLQTLGSSIAVVQDVATTSAGAVDVSVADDGTLAYLTGGIIADEARTLVWVDRQGVETAIALPAHPYVHPRLSRDGRRIAVNAVDGELDLFLSQVDRPALTRFTAGAGVDSFPVWSVDDKRLFYSSQRNSAGNLYSQATDGSRDVLRLTDSPNLQASTGVSPDGGLVIFTEAGDVMQMPLDGSGQVTPLLRTPFIERNGTLSPDGRWLAYEANDSGQFEVYVRPFPDVNSGVHPVSLDGGNRPLWSPKGDELFYVSRDGSLMRVGVVPGTSWAATTATVVVKTGYFTSPGNFGRTYDVSPDAQRFLMIKPQDDPGSARRHLVVVLNWIDELKRLLPVK